MLDSGTTPPLRVAKIQVFQVGEGTEDAVLNSIIQVIKDKYGNIVQTNHTFQFSMNGALCQLGIDKLEKLLVFSSTVKYDSGCELRNVIDNGLNLFDLSSFASSSTRPDLLSTFVTFIPLTKDEGLARSLVDQYSDSLSRPKIGIGIVRGCLLSILESGIEEEELFNRYYYLSPYLLPSEAAEKRTEEILDDIKRLAVYTAQISRLYSGCKNFFSLEPGETEVTEKTEEFLWKLLTPSARERVDLKTLESWLDFIMERDSTISAMAETMRVNHMEAKSIINRIEDIFKKLNERSFEDYPRNSELELRTYHKAIEPFEKTIVRSEALKARLGTVMDEVRTYMSLQQQKITIDEQKASKEQLVRLVNLQEILHKLEILIVAFYITEMASLVFEALAHEIALLLTAAFIPFALLVAVGISRLLHRPQEP